MKPVLKLATLGCAALAATVLVAGPANASPAHRGHHHSHPVFVQTDNPAGNSIVAYDRTSSGSLVPAGSYATGGLGGSLGSQGGLAYGGRAHLLLAVNAGSNTITTFAVHGDRLARHQVLSSGGTDPVSIAVHGDQVFVLNARDGGSIQGYLRIGRFLVRVQWWHRDLGLDTSNGTPAEITFTPNGHQLIVTDTHAANSVQVFHLDRLGSPSAPTTTPLPGTVPFGATFDRSGQLAVAEAGPNAVATFTVNRDDTLTQLDTLATGQAGTCWISAVRGKLYLSNAGSGSVSGASVTHNGALTGLGITPTDAGTLDSAVSSDGRYLYVQTGAAGDVDEFRIDHDGALVSVGSVAVPNAVGGQGIVAL